MAISAFNRAPLGVTLSHVAPSGATHSSAFHTIRSCFVNNQIVTNNVLVKVEVYNSASDFNAGNPMIDSFTFTFTLLKNTVTVNKGQVTVTQRDDILVQAYNQLMTQNAPGHTATNYSAVTDKTINQTDDLDSRPDTDKKS
jgi:hypothetical protein